MDTKTQSLVLKYKHTRARRHKIYMVHELSRGWVVAHGGPDYTVWMRLVQRVKCISFTSEPHRPFPVKLFSGLLHTRYCRLNSTQQHSRKNIPLRLPQSLLQPSPLPTFQECPNKVSKQHSNSGTEKQSLRTQKE